MVKHDLLKRKAPSKLLDAITKAIDAHNKKHPKLTVGQVLAALDRIYGVLLKTTVKLNEKAKRK